MESKTYTPAGEVSNLASLEGLINYKIYYEIDFAQVMSKKRGDIIYAQHCWNFKPR